MANAVNSSVPPLIASITVVEDRPIQGLPQVKWAGPTKAHWTLTRPAHLRTSRTYRARPLNVQLGHIG